MATTCVPHTGAHLVLKVEGDHDDGWWFCVHLQMRTLGLRGLIQEMLGVSTQLQLWVSSPALSNCSSSSKSVTGSAFMASASPHPSLPPLLWYY